MAGNKNEEGKKEENLMGITLRATIVSRREFELILSITSENPDINKILKEAEDSENPVIIKQAIPSQEPQGDKPPIGKLLVVISVGDNEKK